MKNIFQLISALLVLTISAAAQPGIITTVAGTGVSSSMRTGNGGPATDALLANLRGVTVDPYGNLYIAEFFPLIRRVNALGTIDKFAGTDTMGYAGDGNPALLARISRPTDVTTDALGNLYIVDQFKYVIRKVDAYGIISTFAGNGVNGCNGDGLPAISAQIGRPAAITADIYGNIYFTDVQHQVVRKVNTSGIITTVAGIADTFGYKGDGGAATLAAFRTPQGIAADNFGNIYISDYGNNVIRKVNPAGIISTIAGDGNRGFGGDGGSAVLAKLNAPAGIAVDKQNNLYIADPGNHRIRKVDASGIISTIAGGDTTGYTGNGGPATDALLNQPNDVAVDGAGNIYISDRGNGVIRKINSTLSASSLAVEKRATIYPNPCSASFNLHLATTSDAHIELVNSIGQTVYSTRSNQQDISIHLPPGITNGLYMVRISFPSASEYMPLTVHRR